MFWKVDCSSYVLEQTSSTYEYTSFISSTVGVHARSKSDVESVAASQQASSFSGTDCAASTRVAFVFPEASRKIVVVSVILVHASISNVKALTDDVTSDSHASIRGSSSEF